MSTSPLMFDPLVVNNLLGKSFIDIGCGHGKWGYLLKKYRRGGGITVTGIDLFEPHLPALRKEGVYNHLEVANATSLPFADKSFDSAVACEIIEHLPRNCGRKLLAELMRVSKMSFVVTTPNFPCIRGGCNTLNGFNEYEAHLCYYDYCEFRDLGFTQVIGMGLKTWRGNPSRALGSLGYYLPRFSRYLVGFWFADGKKRQLLIE